MSKGVAGLSMDKKSVSLLSNISFYHKHVRHFVDGIRVGGGALTKGISVGKGLIGVTTQSVSGALDLLSKTAEGANTMRKKIAEAIASKDEQLRRRLPWAFGGDNLLRPYDENKAKGQIHSLLLNLVFVCS
ncbi:hypothetical protein C2S53_018848 [Perilla frutescens var. hirtella]|uniref:Vacuolar protein sorting-associated protein 13 DH-like domain-containing protein n=1 Tax=Perilla frutescens var. hirtella TaxID=608512 RepID=A0AAD4IUW2_PERFH|nr:hypothetical protein C2S53_018848 [Perilla frutescens var. hirtella]